MKQFHACHIVTVTPFTLRYVTLRNRIVVSPMCQYLAVDGAPGEWHFAHHARFALGGVGACIAEATAVTRDGRITALHKAHGVVPGVQIGHVGGKAATQRPWEGAGSLPETGPEPLWEIIGPAS